MVHLEEYKKELEKIYQCARENDITETEINRILQNSFYILEKKNKKINFHVIKSMVIILCIIVICFIFFDKKILAIVLLRNLQNSIYPGLKLLRQIAIPIIQHYPSLSGMLIL